MTSVALIATAIVVATVSITGAARVVDRVRETISNTDLWAFAALVVLFTFWRTLLSAIERRDRLVPSGLRQTMVAAPLAWFGGGYASIYGGTNAFGQPRNETEATMVAVRANTLAAPLCALSLANLWPVYFLSVLSASSSQITMAVYISALPWQVYSFVALGAGCLLLHLRERRRTDGHRRSHGAGRRNEGRTASFWRQYGLQTVFLMVLVLGVLDRQRGGDTSIVAWAIYGTLCAIAATIATLSPSPSELTRAGLSALPTTLRCVALVFAAYVMAALANDLSAFEGFSASLVSLPPCLTAFSLTAAVSMLTGSSWAATAVVAPVMLALLSPSPALIGAILSGAVLGDHAMPHSDTTVGSATAANVAVGKVVRAQAPSALVAALVSVIVFGSVDATAHRIAIL